MSRITVPTLFKFGGFTFPTDYIKIDTYEAAPNQRQDLDSYTDASGETHRNALAKVKTQVTFTTRQLRNSEFEGLMAGITGAYDNPNERDAHNCEYWDWEYQKMRTGRHMYLDPSLKIKVVNLIPSERNPGAANYDHNLEVYLIDEIKWTFIEYGAHY